MLYRIYWLIWTRNWISLATWYFRLLSFRWQDMDSGFSLLNHHSTIWHRIFQLDPKKADRWDRSWSRTGRTGSKERNPTDWRTDVNCRRFLIPYLLLFCHLNQHLFYPFADHHVLAWSHWFFVDDSSKYSKRLREGIERSEFKIVGQIGGLEFIGRIDASIFMRM